jgi:hypothetical protein
VKKVTEAPSNSMICLTAVICFLTTAPRSDQEGQEVDSDGEADVVECW